MSKVQLAKVKRVMQDVEGTGQVPKQVIQSMVDLVELFVDDVVERAAESVKNTGAQAETPAALDEKVLHAIVENEKSFDFLRSVRVVVPAVAYKPRSNKRRRTKETASDATLGSENGQEEKTLAESENDGTYKLPPLAEEPLSLSVNAAPGQSGDASSDDEYD